MTKTPTILGHTPCPICDNASAEVRTDRNDLAYIYCASGCYTQVFTRDKHRDSLLRGRMRPISAAVASPAPTPTPVPAPAPIAQPAPAAPAVSPPPSAAKPRSTWLTTLLDKTPAK
jgi:hypothetical protein